MRLLAVCVTAVSLAACGVAGGGAASSSPTPTPSELPLPSAPAAGFEVLITDQERAVAVHVGQKVEVVLRARSGMTNWGAVQVDDAAVLAPVPTGITVARGYTVAGFEARTAGVANLTAYATAQCPPNAMCPMYAMLFSVRVTVT